MDIIVMMVVELEIQ